MLVHRTDHLCTEQCGSRSCQRPRCHTCPYASPETKIRGPKCYFSIREHFTCQSSNLVYCISCNRCPTILHIGETGQSLRSRLGEHLLSILNRTPWVPCGPTSTLWGMQLRNGTNFQLGIVQPDGLNINFSFI